MTAHYKISLALNGFHEYDRNNMVSIWKDWSNQEKQGYLVKIIFYVYQRSHFNINAKSTLDTYKSFILITEMTLFVFIEQYSTGWAQTIYKIYFVYISVIHYSLLWRLFSFFSTLLYFEMFFVLSPFRRFNTRETSVYLVRRK